VTDQPLSPPRAADDAEAAQTNLEDTASQPIRRLPGEPHPYMLQRNPPNLWILVWLTVFSLGLTVLVLALTVVL
jgi:hypothetical protein